MGRVRLHRFVAQTPCRDVHVPRDEPRAARTRRPATDGNGLGRTPSDPPDVATPVETAGRHGSAACRGGCRGTCRRGRRRMCRRGRRRMCRRRHRMRDIVDDAQRATAARTVLPPGTVRRLDAAPRTEVDHRTASPPPLPWPFPPPNSTGLPCSCQASIPPRTQMPSYPTCARYCRTRIDRPLERHTT